MLSMRGIAASSIMPRVKMSSTIMRTNPLPPVHATGHGIAAG
jgi:hypothetical protein